MIVSFSTVSDSGNEYRIIKDGENHTVIPESVLSEACELALKFWKRIGNMRQLFSIVFENSFSIASVEFLQVPGNRTLEGNSIGQDSSSFHRVR